MSSANGILLACTLEIAVPLRIAELQRHGGPTPEEMARVQGFVNDLLARGEHLLYRSEERGQGAARFAQVADAVAVLAKAPDAARREGQHFEAVAEDGGQGDG